MHEDIGFFYFSFAEWTVASGWGENGKAKGKSVLVR
jgi:hypothetical protein